MSSIYLFVLAVDVSYYHSIPHREFYDNLVRQKTSRPFSQESSVSCGSWSNGVIVLGVLSIDAIKVCQEGPTLC